MATRKRKTIHVDEDDLLEAVYIRYIETGGRYQGVGEIMKRAGISESHREKVDEILDELVRRKLLSDLPTSGLLAPSRRSLVRMLQEFLLREST